MEESSLIDQGKSRVLFLLESRATFGYSIPVLRHAHGFSDLEILIQPCGAHTDPRFGRSWETERREVADVVPDARVLPEIYCTSGDGSKFHWGSAFASYQLKFTSVLAEKLPDLVILFGDRMETLAMCLSSSFADIPVAHVQAGDRSGHIDDQSRHAIARFAKLHLPSNEESAARLIRAGESPWRVVNVGAPQLDDVALVSDSLARQTLAELGIDADARLAVVALHPTYEMNEEETAKAVSAIYAALKEADAFSILWIYPNNDAGFEGVLRNIPSDPNLVLIPNLPRLTFLSVLKMTDLLIGNSSAGILETPSLRTPSIDIGERQSGRLRAASVLHVDDFEVAPIRTAIITALTDQAFLNECHNVESPYFKENSGLKTMEVIGEFLRNQYFTKTKCMEY